MLAVVTWLLGASMLPAGAKTAFAASGMALEAATSSARDSALGGRAEVGFPRDARIDPGAEVPPHHSRPIPIENLDGVLLLSIDLKANEKDTTGVAILDTGAGPLVLDRGLARWLDFAADTSKPIARTPGPIAGFRVQGLEPTVADFAYLVELATMRAAMGRPLLALAGASLWREHAIAIDPRVDSLWLFPAATVPTDDPEARIEHSRARLADWVRSASRPVPFELRGDAKIVLDGTLEGARGVTWILDTGATKTALFRRALDRSHVRLPRRPELRGLVAATLMGNADVRHRRLGTLAVRGAHGDVPADSVDAAVLDSPLADALAEVVGEPVHGLLGMSYLRRFRFAVDYGSRVLWLEPIPVDRDQRPYEHCTVGLQLAREAGHTLVQAVARPSPAADRGLRAGDRLLRVDGADVDALDLAEVQRRLEGPPRVPVTIVVERQGRELVRTLERRWLL